MAASRLQGAAQALHSPPMSPGQPTLHKGPADTRAIVSSAHGRARARQRDPLPARAAQARPEGRSSLDPAAPAGSAGVPGDGEGLRHAPGRPEVRPRQGEQDPRRTAGSRRARRSAASRSASAPSSSRCSTADGRRIRTALVGASWVGPAGRRPAPHAAGPHAAAALGSAMVFVITGPSGVGKGTLIAALRARHPEIGLSVSATTRRRGRASRTASPTTSSPRRSSSGGCARGEFVEHATYAGHRYGTLRAELERRTRGGAPVVLEIELQGARQVRAAMPEAVADLHRAAVARGAPRAAARRAAGRSRRRRAAPRDRARTSSRRATSSRIVIVNDDLERAIATNWSDDLPTLCWLT